MVRTYRTMIKCIDWPIGVCTWSLDNNFDKISELAEQTGLSHLNLGIAPALGKKGEKYLSRVQKEGWNITATMMSFPQEDYSTLESIKATGGIVPDRYWEETLKRLIDAMDITVRLGVKYLAFHFGFLDHAGERAMIFNDRARLLADAAADRGIMILMETGQETAAELKQFLEELNHPALGVNLDPANMILYDKGNPIEAANTLAPWIQHIHVKDALRTKIPGTWGQEVPWGSGQVGGPEFLRALKQINFTGALAIEREAGESRLDDIKTAIDALKNFVG